ncbi:glycosyltransferase family 4 protein [Clostridium paridis]|uniref:Glycosyltransferase family 4 protein n=1 Tax=Clostridium paridis TaxID=2803863 RepID=A0A937K221_9CLOT|nr:glycosyltransferase family 4 protein [Clostridium paridis]MBL4930252.1 glycosyltransferase family 4 protein [Clostridium paridis]
MTGKVCHITTVHKKNDDRILYKECMTLKEEGYEVYLIATNEKEETINGVKIIPINKYEGRLKRFFSMRKEALEKAIELNADIYHFHDPELILLGNKLRKMGKKVVYDAHEDVPAQIMSKTYLGNKFVRQIVSKAFNIFEKGSTKKYAGFVTVTEGIGSKFNNNRKIVLKNYPVKKIIDNSVPIEIDKDKPVVIYVGGLTRIRGIKELVEATGKLNGKCQLWLLGEWESEEYHKECMNLSGWQNTKYYGYMPMDEVYQYIKAADIGACVLYPTGNHMGSLPIKAFEYMACSKPIIMSDFPYWRDNFGDFAALVPPQDVDALAKTIEGLLDNKEVYNEKIRNSQKVFEDNFSWESESLKLKELYKQILESK